MIDLQHVVFSVFVSQLRLGMIHLHRFKGGFGKMRQEVGEGWAFKLHRIEQDKLKSVGRSIFYLLQIIDVCVYSAITD